MLGILSFYLGTLHPSDGDNRVNHLLVLAAHAVRPDLAVVRAVPPLTRPTIIGRPDFFVRYGEKEREAVASFDFLDDLSTTSSSVSRSIDEVVEEELEATEEKILKILTNNNQELVDSLVISEFVNILMTLNQFVKQISKSLGLNNLYRSTKSNSCHVRHLVYFEVCTKLNMLLERMAYIRKHFGLGTLIKYNFEALSLPRDSLMAPQAKILKIIFKDTRFPAILMKNPFIQKYRLSQE
ncbi:hypothetical protein NQ317_002074 [Molorchus minor]|uniref:Uncharacterized protein n=1 Tax=Molorchus minor TaxID=1323400 RepID=A0ABQ9JM46_9CUCU|nr:hypothetical protein NQ317_002074 [Molorchus minor]